MADACDAALVRATADDLVLVTGSLYVVGDARPHLLKPSASSVRLALASPSRSWLAMLIAPSSSASPTPSSGASSARSSSRFERNGLAIAALELRTLDEEILARHYEEHQGKGFYDELVAFMSRGPGRPGGHRGPGGHLEGRAGHDGRHQPPQRGPGHDQGRLGIEFTENLIHGSDSAESAARELGIFFPEP